MNDLRRSIGVLAIVMIAAAGCSQPEDSDAAAPTKATTTTSTVAPTTVAPTTSTTTTSTIPEVLPLRIDEPSSIVHESHRNAFSSGPIEVRVETRTGAVTRGGRLESGERVHVLNYWDGDVMVGSASFSGPAGISVRANQNRELAASLLLFGSSYSFDGEWLVGERRLFNTISEEVDEAGSEWIKIQVEMLNEEQNFALGLLAPFTSGMPIESSKIDDDFAEVLLLLERRGGWSVYEHEVTGPASSGTSTVVIDGDGRLREWYAQSSDFGESEFRGAIRLLDEIPVQGIDPVEADDITAAFAAYASARFESNPGSLGG